MSNGPKPSYRRLRRQMRTEKRKKAGAENEYCSQPTHEAPGALKLFLIIIHGGPNPVAMRGKGRE